MPYMIKVTDKPDSLAKRTELRAPHIEYVSAHADKILAAGALLTDDGSAVHGGLVIFDCEDRATAEAYINNDPLAKAGVFATIEISRWRKAYFDRKCLV